ncbi:MAG TPA: PilZ domain-containing protein, partial [Thermoanaerobaculia bacterium]
MTEDDRRRVERVTFSEPLTASIGGEPGHLVDLGMLGARVRNEQPFPIGAEVRIEFVYDGEPIGVLGRVTRSEFQQVLSEARGQRIFMTAVEFVSADPWS